MPVQRTSLEAYQNLKDSGALKRMRDLVYRELIAYHERYQQWPTAYELFDAMLTKGQVRDLNDVRPQLTHLKELGRVYNPEVKRHCRITNKRAFTWCPSTVPPPAQVFAEGLF